MVNILSNNLEDQSKNIIISAGVQFGNFLCASAIIHISIEPKMGDLLLYLDLPANCILHSLRFRNTRMDLIEGDELLAINNALVIGIYASSEFIGFSKTLFDDEFSKNKFKENDAINPFFFGTSETMFNRRTDVDGVETRYAISGSNTNTGIEHMQDALWKLAGLQDDPSVSLRIGAKISREFGEFVPGISIVEAFFTCKN